MKVNFSNTEFFKELKSSLPASTLAKRNIWVNVIIERDIDIKELSKLLNCEPKIATRFLWLLTEIGEINSNKLFTALPFLLDLCDRLNPVYKTSFANFWLIAGVPPENEARAIDLLFQWLLSTETNVTIKSRSLRVLLKLTKKYPELKNELKLCLTDQMNKHTNVFEKRVTKILIELEQ